MIIAVSTAIAKAMPSLCLGNACVLAVAFGVGSSWHGRLGGSILELEHEQLALALVDGDSGIQNFLDFFKALVGFRHLHEHIHDGVPSVVLNEAFDDVDCVHEWSLADSTRRSQQDIWRGNSLVITSLPYIALCGTSNS